MKRFLVVVLIAISFAAPAFLAAAENKSAPAAGVAPPAFAGKYAGTWKGPSNTSGDLRITLKREGSAPWMAEAAFSFEGTEVPMKMKSVEIDGAKILLVFDWAVDGTPGQSKLTGELSGDKLGGTYQTVTETPSSGTWTVTRQ